MTHEWIGKELKNLEKLNDAFQIRIKQIPNFI